LTELSVVLKQKSFRELLQDTKYKLLFTAAINSSNSTHYFLMEFVNRILSSSNGKYIAFSLINKIVIFFKDIYKFLQVYPIGKEVSSFLTSCFWTNDGSLFIFVSDDKMLFAYSPEKNLRYLLRFVSFNKEVIFL
jgi:hypothetical protein